MTLKVKYYFNLDGTVESKIWRNEKGEYHRENGSACESSNGRRYWYKNNKYHREDGPAIVWENGYHEYYLIGKEYTKEEYWKEIRKKRE